VKFYVSALVGVMIKVILQNARCNNRDILSSFGSEYAIVVSCSDPCDELAGSTKDEGFVNHMTDCLMLKVSAPCN